MEKRYQQQQSQHQHQQQASTAPSPSPASKSHLGISEKELTEAGYRAYNPGAKAGASVIYRRVIPWSNERYLLWCDITWYPEINKSGAERPEKYDIEFEISNASLGNVRFSLNGALWQKRDLQTIEDFALKFADRVAGLIPLTEK